MVIVLDNRFDFFTRRTTPFWIVDLPTFPVGVNLDSKVRGESRSTKLTIVVGKVGSGQQKGSATRIFRGGDEPNERRAVPQRISTRRINSPVPYAHVFHLWTIELAV